MSVSRKVVFLVMGADGSGKAGLTVNTDFFAYYTIVGSLTTAITTASDLGDGFYSASVSADATDEVILTGKYTDGDVTLPVVGWPVSPWVVSTFDAANDGVILGATQSNYAPAKAGDAMTLTAGERTAIGTAVWATTTRTLSSFGTLVADIWANATRTLTAFAFTPSLDAAYDKAKTAAQASDIPSASTIAAAVWNALTSGMTTAGSIGKKLADWVVGKVLSVQADAIDAASIKQDARDAIATTVESHLLDEGDSQMLINAIVEAIGNVNMDQTVLVAAIRADLERTGGNLNTVIGRLTASRAANLDNLDATVSSAKDSADAAKASADAALRPTTAGRTLDVDANGQTAANNMRGTDNAYTGTPPTKEAIAAQVWADDGAPAVDEDGNVFVDMGQSTPGGNTLGGQLDKAGTASGVGVPGGDAVTITITDPTSGNPIADADVWVTSTASRTTVVDGTYQTNSSGEVTFTLSNGVTYYLWAQKDGRQAISGTQFQAVKDG